MTAALAILAFIALWGLVTWGILKADAADERRHRQRMAGIVGTPEWFAAQRQKDG